jgi:uncharacterized protein (DUF1778 family)
MGKNPPAEPKVPNAATRAGMDEVDQRVISLSPDAFREFMAHIDRPGEPIDDIRRLMQTRAPWETTKP